MSNSLEYNCNRCDSLVPDDLTPSDNEIGICDNPQSPLFGEPVTEDTCCPRFKLLMESLPEDEYN